MPEFHAIAPSNIALIKYWGRDDEILKWPTNDSLSMTLTKAFTRSSASIVDGNDHCLILNGVEKSRRDDPKVFKFLDFLIKEVVSSSIKAPHLSIVTQNSFPTGCGLASSASGFAALTLASLGALLGETQAAEMLRHDTTRQRVAHWARIGSGSATRSLYGGYVQWHKGESPDSQSVSTVLEKDSWKLYDTVVLFSEKEKEISSSQAHKLAFTSPLFKARLASLPYRLDKMKKALNNRDMRTLGPLIEDECLEMHSVMMSSTPPVFYFSHEVGDFLAWFRKFRERSGLEAYFTMDAGPNVHILCESDHLEALHEALAQKLPEVSLFVDQVGEGPRFEWGGNDLD